MTQIERKIDVNFIEDVDVSAWNDFNLLRNAPYYSCFEFAKIREALYYEKPFFITFYLGEERVGQLLLLESYPDPRLIQSYAPFRKMTGYIMRKIFKRAIWNDGPIFSDISKEDKIHFINTAFQYLELLKFKKVTCSFNENLKKCNPNIINWGTFIIDIKKYDSIESHLKKLPSTTRYQIRKADRDGVTTSLIDDEKSIIKYSIEWGKTWQNKKGLKPSLRNTLKYFDYNKHLQSKDYEYLWIGAYHNGELIAGVCVPIFGKYAGIESFFTSDYARNNHLFAGDLLIWRAIVECYKRDVWSLDLFGVNPEETRSRKEDGIYFFKSRWNGNFKLYSTYRKLMPKDAYFLEQDLVNGD